MQTKQKIEELRQKSHQRPSVADKKKNLKEISAENESVNAGPYSGATISEIKRNATEYKRGEDENKHAMSGADDTRLLKHYAKQISGEEVAAELILDNKKMAEDLYTFVNGKKPTTEQLANMVSASIAYSKLHPTSEVPHILAKREAPQSANNRSRGSARVN